MQLFTLGSHVVVVGLHVGRVVVLRLWSFSICYDCVFRPDVVLVELYEGLELLKALSQGCHSVSSSIFLKLGFSVNLFLFFPSHHVKTAFFRLVIYLLHPSAFDPQGYHFIPAQNRNF